MAEENGTYVNRDRRVQRFQQAQVARRAWRGRRGGWRARSWRARARRRVRRPRRARRSTLSRRVLAGVRRRSAMPTSASPAASLRAGRTAGAAAMTPELKGFLLLSVLKLLVVFTVDHGRRRAADADGAEGRAPGCRTGAGPNRVGWAGCCSRRPTASRTFSRKRPSRPSANRSALHPGPGTVLHSGAAALGGHSLGRAAAGRLRLHPAAARASSSITA